MFRSAGQPLEYMLTPEDIVRFMQKVEVIDLPGTKSHGCWKWCAGRLKKDLDYGAFWYKGRCHPAHRISFQTFVGPLEQGEDVHHAKCRNPWCVNPRHLEALTRSENVADGNANREMTAIQFLGGPLDGEEKLFYPGRYPKTFEIRSYGQLDWYRFSDDLREYIYEGRRRITKRH